ncbi:MAG TPA: hypothetical protein VFB22_05900 [Candidatus Baltobacteraceae bacterium]|nr:hypothetical protein [Candidatus Baltobacteraceae bacterium]
MTTWYDEMLADVDRLLGLLDQIGAYDDKHRPYSTVLAELRADSFVRVQRAVVDLANRVHTAKEIPCVDEGLVCEAMELLVEMIPYMRYASRAGAYCEGGFAVLVVAIEKMLGSMVMSIRSRMGIIDASAERPW